nr:MAG TPA: hypothetical protein [Caudoviricetes sp.]
MTHEGRKQQLKIGALPSAVGSCPFQGVIVTGNAKRIRRAKGLASRTGKTDQIAPSCFMIEASAARSITHAFCQAGKVAARETPIRVNQSTQLCEICPEKRIRRFRRVLQCLQHASILQLALDVVADVAGQFCQLLCHFQVPLGQRGGVWQHVPDSLQPFSCLSYGVAQRLLRPLAIQVGFRQTSCCLQHLNGGLVRDHLGQLVDIARLSDDCLALLILGKQPRKHFFQPVRVQARHGDVGFVFKPKPASDFFVVERRCQVREFHILGAHGQAEEFCIFGCDVQAQRGQQLPHVIRSAANIFGKRFHLLLGRQVLVELLPDIGQVSRLGQGIPLLDACDVAIPQVAHDIAACGISDAWQPLRRRQRCFLPHLLHADPPPARRLKLAIEQLDRCQAAVALDNNQASALLGNKERLTFKVAFLPDGSHEVLHPLVIQHFLDDGCIGCGAVQAVKTRVLRIEMQMLGADPLDFRGLCRHSLSPSELGAYPHGTACRAAFSSKVKSGKAAQSSLQDCAAPLTARFHHTLDRQAPNALCGCRRWKSSNGKGQAPARRAK